MIKKINEIRKTDLFKIKLSGILIFRVIPYIKITPDLIKENLGKAKEEFERIQLEYSNVNIKFFLDNQTIKMEVMTPKHVYSFDKKFIEKFTSELNILFNKIDSNIFMKQINLSGFVKTISYQNNFQINCENDNLKILHDYKYRKILGIVRI